MNRAGLLKSLQAFLCLVAGQLPFLQHLRADEGTGLIGEKLSIVEQKNDLFVFFNFAPTGKETSADGRTVTTAFKPTGEAFRALVTLDVVTDAQDVIQSLRLVVARSFIDDAKKCIYAADLVKSYLGNAGVASAGDPIAALADEISARSMQRSSVTLLTREPLPTVPAQPSPAYETYAGTGPAQTLSNRSGSVQVSLQNREQDGEAVFEAVMAAR